MKKEQAKKTIINFLILIFLSFGMIYAIYKKTNPKDLKRVFFAMKKEYIAYAIVLFIIFRLMEAISLYVLFKKVGQKTSLRDCFDYSIFGHFFAQMTPSGGGGQPAQLYFMTKDKIPGDKSLAAIVPFNIMYHISLPIVGILSLTTSLRTIIFSSRLSFFFYLGILTQLFLAAIVILALKKSEWLYKLMVFISEKIKNTRFFGRFYKSPDRIKKFLDDLKNNVNDLLDNKIVFLIIFFLQVAMLIASYGISYFTYRALGFSDYGFLDIVRIQCLLIMSTEYIPTPGTAGFSELAFFEIYKNIIADDYALSWMMINRLLPLYLALIFTIIILILRTFRKNKEN